VGSFAHHQSQFQCAHKPETGVGFQCFLHESVKFPEGRIRFVTDKIGAVGFQQAGSTLLRSYSQ